MAEVVDLAFLAQQSERILSELKNVRVDMRDMKRRLTGIEGAFGLLLSQVATFTNRLDRIEERVEALEE